MAAVFAAINQQSNRNNFGGGRSSSFHYNQSSTNNNNHFLNADPTRTADAPTSRRPSRMGMTPNFDQQALLHEQSHGSGLMHANSGMQQSTLSAGAGSAVAGNNNPRGSNFGSTRFSDQDIQQLHQLQQHQQELAAGVQVSELELANIQRIFDQFDADGSRTIDVDELSLVMTSLGVQMDQTQLTELVEQVTNEGEQELTFDEFVSLITLWKEAAQYKLFEGDGFKSLAKQHVDKALQSPSLIPDSPLRSAWDVLVAVVALLYWIFVLMLDAYTIDAFNVPGMVTGDVLCTLFLIADISVCAKTAFVRDGRTVDDTAEVWENYRATWFVPDVIAAIPFDVVLTAAGATVAATVLRHLRLLKLVKLPYLWRASDATPITSGYITFHFHLLPIFQLLISFIIMVHGFATGWILLKQIICSPDESDTSIIRWNRTVTALVNGTALVNTTVAHCSYPYVPALYFIIYSMSTVGLGDITVSGEAEQWYSCLVLVGAMLSNGIVIGKLVQILQRADIKKEQRSKIRETLAVLEHYHIASQLQTEILQFQAHVFENNLGAAYESIISGLPAEMRTNISLFVRMKLVSVVPLFMESHFMLRIAVAQVLTNAVARPEQYICVAGQKLNGLFFLAYGFADTFDPDGAYRQTLRSGDFFGEESLLGSGSVSESVKALTFCDLWILHGDTFTTLLQRFPKFRRTVELLRSVSEGVASSEHSSTKNTSRHNSHRGRHFFHQSDDHVADGDQNNDNCNSKHTSSRRESRGHGPIVQQQHVASKDDGDDDDDDGNANDGAKNKLHVSGGALSQAEAALVASGPLESASRSATPAGDIVVLQPTMSVAEIHRFVHEVRLFKERLRQATLMD